MAACDIHSKQTSHEFQGRSVSCRNKGDFGNSFIKVFFFFCRSRHRKWTYVLFLVMILKMIPSLLYLGYFM